MKAAPYERSLSVVTRVGAKPCFLEPLTDELPGRGFVPPALDQDLQHLALIINRPSQIHLPAIDPHHHLIQMPARAGLAPQLPQVPRDHRPELADPAPDRLIGDIQPTLGQQVLNVPVIRREAEIKLHRVLDDGGRKLLTGV